MRRGTKMAASLCRRGFLNYKHFLYQVQKRTGYVVLIPESPNEVADFSVISLENLPDFSLLKLKTCKQLFHQYAQQYDIGSWEIHEHLEKQLKFEKTVDVFKNVIEPLEVLTVPFLTTWGVIRTLYAAQNDVISPKYFFTFTDRFFQIRNEKFDKESLYLACKNHLKDFEQTTTAEQKRVIKKFVWEGLHNGFELDFKKRSELKRCYDVIEARRKSYEIKYLNSLTLFNQVITEETFRDNAPADLLRLTATTDNPNSGPWRITLKSPVYWRYMEYCSSRQTRFSTWTSYNQLASNYLDTSCNCTTEVENILLQRQNVAKLLGFETYAHLSMHTKMAGSVENVQIVLTQLLESAKFGQEKEVYELEKFAIDNGFQGTIELWDLPYWKRKWLDEKIGLNEKKLKEYFPAGQVLLGLIALCEQLFGIEIQEQRAIECWNPDVRYFRISDERTKSILGGFYFDPYDSPNKLFGSVDGLFVPIRPRSRIIASLPLSALIFNFTPPSEDTPSLLYYKDIQNLFAKFGQMLQYTLTETCYSEVSGLSNVEWDAVDICSNFLKFWLTEKGTLESISGHYKTGEALPSHVLENVCNIHKHMAGTDLSREIYFSNLDLFMHMRGGGVLNIVKDLWPQHFLFDLDAKDRHVFGFKDVFLTPHGSSVYSNVWGKMVGADIFCAFSEAGLENLEEVSAIGRRLRSTYFALGGSCDAAEVFRRFRNREPDPKLLIDLLDLPTAAYFEPDSTPKAPLIESGKK